MNKKEKSFTCKVKEAINEHIIDNEIIDDNFLDKVTIRKILRKKFVESGEVNDPEKDTHLEFLVKSVEEANKIVSYLSYIDIEAKITIRKKLYAVYIKDQMSVIRLLNMLGAKKLSKIYDEVKSKKTISCHINRTTNFEVANLKKITDASIRQCDDIDKLLKKRKIETLDIGLQDVIKYRKKYKELSTAELAEKLNITKSCLIHRLNKIHKMAEG